MKSIPFDLFKAIIHHLPENRKMEWMIKIFKEEGEEKVKSRMFEVIGELHIDELNEAEFKRVLEMINIKKVMK